MSSDSNKRRCIAIVEPPPHEEFVEGELEFKFLKFKSIVWQHESENVTQLGYDWKMTVKKTADEVEFTLCCVDPTSEFKAKVRSFRLKKKSNLLYAYLSKDKNTTQKKMLNETNFAEKYENSNLLSKFEEKNENIQDSSILNISQDESENYKSSLKIRYFKNVQKAKYSGKAKK